MLVWRNGDHFAITGKYFITLIKIFVAFPSFLSFFLNLSTIRSDLKQQRYGLFGLQNICEILKLSAKMLKLFLSFSRILLWTYLWHIYSTFETLNPRIKLYDSSWLFSRVIETVVNGRERADHCSIFFFSLDNALKAIISNPKKARIPVNRHLNWQEAKTSRHNRNENWILSTSFCIEFHFQLKSCSTWDLRWQNWCELISEKSSTRVRTKERREVLLEFFPCFLLNFSAAAVVVCRPMDLTMDGTKFFDNVFN